jgi:hypothetical protein
MMTRRVVTEIPYKSDYNRFLSRLTPEETGRILDTLNEMIDGDEIHTAGWMPGSDWTGTAFEPLYTKAARRDQNLAAQAFGLFVWRAFMERPEVWTSGRFEKDGEPIGSRTYFRVREGS